jgi:hypothetical protein
MNLDVRTVALRYNPNCDQHQIVLTDKSRASEQVVFEFPKRDPKWES